MARFRNEKFEYQGRLQTIKEWAEETGIPYWTLNHRIARGLTIAEAIETPRRARIRPEESIRVPRSRHEGPAFYLVKIRGGNYLIRHKQSGCYVYLEREDYRLSRRKVSLFRTLEEADRIIRLIREKG